MCEEVSFCRQVNGELDDPGHLIERAQVLPCHGKRIQRGNSSGLPALFDIEFLPQPAYEFRFVSNDGKRAAQVEQVTRLEAFDISA